MIPVPEECRSLMAEIIFIIQGIMYDHKKAGFEKIKRSVLRGQIKRLHKNNFESVNTNSQSSASVTGISNYVSVADFRPLEGNYSSIKIIDYESHGIKKDVNAVMAKKIEYTSNQLLNKETFLQNWMVRQPSPQLKPQKYPLSDYAHKKISTYNQQALASVRKFTFSQYCKYNIKKKQGFFSLTQSDPLKYKRTAISASLTYMQQQNNQTAIQLFQCLLRAGGDAQTKQNAISQINQMIQTIIKADDHIRQQAFLQIIKQVSSNKDSYLRVLCCFCYCVAPSTRLYIPLLNYLYQEYTLYQNLPKEILNYCFFHLIRNFDQPRLSSPCLFQLFCAYYCRKVAITVSFPREKVFFVQSYTTVQELLSQLVEYYNLDAHVQYLVQVNGFLMDKGNLLDKLNYYCELPDQDDFKWKDYEHFRGLNAIIVLKNVNDIFTSPRCHSIFYNYCSRQYVRGLYALRSTDIVKIAALKMHSQIADQQKCLFEYDNLISKRKLKNLSQQQKDHYRKHILREYYKLGHVNKVEARKQILDILSKNKGFNTHFFRAQIFVEDYDELVAWVGVQKDRFIVVQPSTGRVMRIIAFTRIIQWGVSKSQLCLRVEDIGEFHIQSRQIEVIASVFKTYLDYYSSLRK